MTLEADLRALAELFGEACSLNREALRALRAGITLQTLNGIFERKRLLGELMARELDLLSRKKIGPGSGESLAHLLQVQRDAATLEVQLVEALGNAVPSNGKFTAAYKNGIPGERSDGLNWSI